jgi:hypothetical protein
MESKEAIKIFFEVAKKHNFGDKALIRGSAFLGAELTPFWSDLDVTLLVDEADGKTLNAIKEMKAEYSERCPAIGLSVTTVDLSDGFETNPFFHLGVKPLSYNYIVAKQESKVVTQKMNLDALRESSVYNYYEIIYTFRRDVINNKEFTADLVAKGYHRLCYLLRRQVEILQPKLIIQLGKVPEREFLNVLEPRADVEEFFRSYDDTKANWEKIRQNKALLSVHRQYLADTFCKIHKAFLPKLRMVVSRCE